MATIETSKRENKAGVWVHPETGATLVAVQHPKFGSAQADAFAAAGYVWKGTAPAKSKAPAEVEEEPESKQPKTAKELRAELAEAEARERRETPLSKQTKDQLLATAKEEGVEVTEDLDTNKKLADAIQAKREEGKK